MSVVLWVDVQTGCVWAGVPLSVHLFAALILGFVCSIWAKFSNGDNYRGRPGERRRWVLPFLLSELHASPSQSTTSPSIPLCLSSFQSPCVSSKIQWSIEYVVLPRHHS